MKSNSTRFLAIFVLILYTSFIYASHNNSHSKTFYKGRANHKLSYTKNQKSSLQNKHTAKNHSNTRNNVSTSQRSHNPSELSQRTKRFISNTIKRKNNPLYDQLSKGSPPKRHPDHSKHSLLHHRTSGSSFSASENSTKAGSIYDGWLTIQSEVLHNSKLFPPIPGKEGLTSNIPADQLGRLVNKLWRRDSKDIPSPYFFWARLKDRYLYFSNSPESEHLLLTIKLDTVKGIDNLRDENYCIKVKEISEWTFCGLSQDRANKWVCLISSTVRNLDLEKECNEKAILSQASTKIVERKVTQPFIIIPTPQAYCNAKWDYESKGKDWQCLCREGLEQSPIDLPKPEDAVESAKKPIFDYKKVGPVHMETSADGRARVNSPVKIEHVNWALRIFHANLGKIVTLDGSVFQAEQIVFRTPSEHTIDGKKFPLEMQVLHRAISKGDFGKYAVLSFLFTPKAGVYNKFIDAIDFFSLPNPNTRAREIYEKLFIPNALLSTDDMESSLLAFSFFTYQGSLTEPPCTEKVLHFVVSEPIQLSTTSLDLFKEALREPDYEDAFGNIVRAEARSLANAREVQKLNGRPVFHYDNTKFGFPMFKNEDGFAVARPKGHFEKQEKESTDYIFVEGSNPSGLPGAVVVSDEEANA